MKNLKTRATLMTLLVLACGQLCLAQSTDYFLERVDIHTRAFQAVLGLEEPSSEATTSLESPTPTEPISVSDSESQEAPEVTIQMSQPQLSWSSQLVKDDLSKLLADLDNWKSNPPKDSQEMYTQLKSGLDRHARRLRVSTSALTLTPQQTMGKDLLLLELEEATRGLDSQRQELAQRRNNRRSSRRFNSNISVGFGGWNNWGPGFWGGGPFFNRGFRRGFGRRGFRRGFRRGCR